MLNPKKVFKIEKNAITCKYQTQIFINTKLYENSNSLIETSTEFIIPGVVNAYIPELNDNCNFMVNYEIKLIKPTSITSEKNIYTLHYNVGDTLIEQDTYINDTNIPLVIKLLEGRAKYITKPTELYNLIIDQVGGIDTVHFEVIMSNMFRCSDDLTQKCRYNGKFNDAVIVGQTMQPFIDSWFSAIAFQYINKGIQTGLVNGKDAVMNPIEKILASDYDSV